VLEASEGSGTRESPASLVPAHHVRFWRGGLPANGSKARDLPDSGAPPIYYDGTDKLIRACRISPLMLDLHV